MFSRILLRDLTMCDDGYLEVIGKFLRTLFAIIIDFSIRREIDFDERALAHSFTFYLYVLYTPFPSHVLLNHPLSPGAVPLRCFLRGAFLLF